MHVNVAKSAGFCFGVKRALDIAFRTASEGKNVFMLGDIVHNETVVKEIEKAGIKKISKLKPASGEVLLTRAHGISKATFSKAKRLGYNIIDATCPMVKEIHKVAREMEEKGSKIIVIGDKKHDEVRGIIGQLKEKALVIDGLKSIPLPKIKSIKNACVVVQSTQNLENVLKIVEALKKYIPALKFFNTICNPTRTKQEEIKSLPLKNDVMIIIGSKNSANTKRLYEISRKINKRSWWVNSKEEIKSAWFKGAKNIGITAGASTPEVTIQEIIKQVKGESFKLS
ncbi:MAG: 4-hydroxy-3-methylbut-2-enyl diphosphate reductase [Candidatus Omnitrophica bacterium]|nr:4-hydroxy-3-methylbut-2-enyl diphosphate reductase [Candidatus Omnitrophota bacterium]